MNASITPRHQKKPKLLTVIVPAFNENETIEEFYARLSMAMNAIQQNYEIVFINDGSQDGTLSTMKRLQDKHRTITIVDLSRNFGKEIATTAGIDNYELLHTAIIQEALVAEEKKLLLNYIESISSKSKVIKSQLIHDEKSRSSGRTNTSLLKIKYERGAR